MVHPYIKTLSLRTDSMQRLQRSAKNWAAMPGELCPCATGRLVYQPEGEWIRAVVCGEGCSLPCKTPSWRATPALSWSAALHNAGAVAIESERGAAEKTAASLLDTWTH
jgi:hypothetical protein